MRGKAGLRLANKTWRIFATGFSFTLFGLSCVLMSVIMTLVLWPIPISPLLKRLWVRRVVQGGCWLFVRVMTQLGLMTFEFENIERLRTRGALVVANHPTLIDAVLLMSVVPNCSCIVKSALTKNPFTSAMVSLADYIPNNQTGEQLIGDAVATLNDGQNLLIFPEGTRSKNGETLAFKRGAANIALSAKCPVVPVVIKCQPPTLRKGQPWYRVAEQASVFRLQVLEPLLAEQYLNPGTPARKLVRHLNERLQDVIGSRL